MRMIIIIRIETTTTAIIMKTIEVGSHKATIIKIIKKIMMMRMKKK